MSAYTTSSDNIYFLNDKNIVSSLEATSKTGFNAIPSQDLFIETYKELSSADKAASDLINSLSTRLSTEIQKLSSDLSGDVKTLSGKLSSEIKSLSASLSGDIDKLSARLSSDIQKLSNDLSSDVASLSTRLSGEIDALSAKLSSEIDQLSNDLCAEVNYISSAASLSVQNLSSYAKSLSDETAKTFKEMSGAVNTEFVHISGDAIKFLDIEGRLSVNGMLNVDPVAKNIGVKANVGINAEGQNIGLTSELFTADSNKYVIKGDENQMFINDRSLKEIEESLSVADFEYRSDLTCLVLTFEDGKKLSVDARAFIKDGMVKSAVYDAATKQIIITFNTDAGLEPIKIDVTDFVKYYIAGDGLKLDDIKNEFSVDYERVASKESLDNALSTFAHTVKFESHLTLNTADSGTKTIEDLLDQAEAVKEYQVKNGLMVSISLTGDKNGRYEILPRHGTGEPNLVVGDGDVLIIHAHHSGNIPMDEIFFTDVGHVKTVFVFSPAISRYEFEEKIEYLSSNLSCTVLVSSDCEISALSALAGPYNNGDIAVIKTTINKENLIAPLHQQYTAYVYSKKTDSFEAMDGNYNAKNVIFDNDITLAGDYDRIGNITKSKTDVVKIDGNGRSMYDIMTQIFAQKIDPTYTAPAFSITAYNGSSALATQYEVGTSITPGLSISLSKGSYTVFTSIDKRTGHSGTVKYNENTGISALQFDACFLDNGVVKESATNSEIQYKPGSSETYKRGFSFASYPVQDGMNVSLSGAIKYETSVYAVNNLNEETTVIIPAGTGKNSASTKATSYRTILFGAIPVAEVAQSNVNDLLWNNAAIKNARVNGKTATKLTISASSLAGRKAFIIAIPIGSGYKTCKKIESTAGMVIDVTSAYSTKTLQVNDLTGANGFNYTVWIWAPATIDDGTIHEVTLG